MPRRDTVSCPSTMDPTLSTWSPVFSATQPTSKPSSLWFLLEFYSMFPWVLGSLYVFGSPGSGSVIVCTDPDPSHRQAKNFRKTVISTVLRIRDVYPGSRILILPIPDLGSKNSNKREGWKKFLVIPFIATTKFTKLKIILFLKCWRTKFWPVFKEL